MLQRSRKEWSVAYAKQAVADLASFDRMKEIGGFVECHKLQLLQMGCEKLVKAHLCKAGSDPEDLQGSHAYTSSNLPIIFRMLLSRFPVSNPSWVTQYTNQLAGEIEVLSPQVDRSKSRPDNCEYPWEDSNGTLHIPIEWSFSPSQMLTIPVARTFLNLINFAAKELADGA